MKLQQAGKKESHWGVSAGVLLLALYLTTCQARAPKQTDEAAQRKVADKADSSPKVREQKMQELIESILKKDPAAVLLARKYGLSASAEVIKLTKHDDVKVRRIALNCLDEIGGAEAVMAMAEALSDDDPQVRAAGLRGLQHHPEPAVYRNLLNAYDEVFDAYTRQQLALLIGKMGTVVKINDLQLRCTKEQAREAQEGCNVALAHLGDQPAQAEFIKHLQETHGADRARYLEYASYLHAPWLLRPLLPILNDKSPMIRVGVDARPDLIDSLRACDLAVILIAGIAQPKFSFMVNRMTNYNDDQLAEVRRFVLMQPN